MQMSGGVLVLLLLWGSLPPILTGEAGCEAKGRGKPWVESWSIWTLVLIRWETVKEPLILFGLRSFVKYWGRAM